MEKISKKFMEKHYKDLDFENLPLVKSILLDEWKNEVKAMVELANIEIHKRLDSGVSYKEFPDYTRINHWIDQYHKMLISMIETKVKQLEEGKGYIPRTELDKMNKDVKI